MAFVHEDVAALKDAGFNAPVKPQKREGKPEKSTSQENRSGIHQCKVRVTRKVTLKFYDKKDDYGRLVSIEALPQERHC